MNPSIHPHRSSKRRIYAGHKITDKIDSSILASPLRLGIEKQSSVAIGATEKHYPSDLGGFGIDSDVRIVDASYGRDVVARHPISQDRDTLLNLLGQHVVEASGVPDTMVNLTIDDPRILLPCLWCRRIPGTIQLEPCHHLVCDLCFVGLSDDSCYDTFSCPICCKGVITTKCDLVAPNMVEEWLVGGDTCAVIRLDNLPWVSIYSSTTHLCIDSGLGCNPSYCPEVDRTP